MKKTDMNIRRSGVLMPIFSLKSGDGIGTLGKPCYDFIDFMAKANLKIWQVLPVTPTGYGNSPYQPCAANAFNYYLIDLRALAEEGYLTVEQIEQSPLAGNSGRVNYGLLFNEKVKLLKQAFVNFNREDKDFKNFVRRGEYTDFCLYMALKEKHDFSCWASWERPFSNYEKTSLKAFEKEQNLKVLFWQFTQYIFIRQWQKVREYAAANGVLIMGDLPLYLSYDSVEMWKYGERLFKVDKDKTPTVVAGAPPDGFSAEGQLWGNPVYDWDKAEKDGYIWWNERLRGAFELYDIVRLDHFRGFDRYYAVPNGESTAVNGHWENGPSFKLFTDKTDWSIVAEDLGVLDEGVYELMRKTGYAGMRELEFAFDGRKDNEHKPSNYVNNLVCYTGTHDNEPLFSYIIREIEDEERAELIISEIRSECKPYNITLKSRSPEDICRSIIELGFALEANTVIIPLWDFMLLGGGARINLPGTQTDDNWSWRVTDDGYLKLSKWIASLAYKYKRK